MVVGGEGRGGEGRGGEGTVLVMRWFSKRRTSFFGSGWGRVCRGLARRQEESRNSFDKGEGGGWG